MFNFATSKPIRRREKAIAPYLYLVPSFVFLVLFVYYPVIKAFYLSFFKWDFAHPIKEFIGFSNYATLVKDPLFWQIVRNNLIYTLGTLIPSLGIGFFLAVLVNTKIKFKAIYRGVAFYPYLLPMAAASMIWVWLYNPVYGIASIFFKFFGFRQIDWLGDKRFALLSLMIVAVWKFTGYYMILFLAGLQSIPNEYYEAATLQGANFWQQVRHITIPLSSPTIFFVGMIFIVNSFQSIDQVYLMTSGGPGNATNMIIYYIFQHISKFAKMGVGATISSFLFMALVGLALLYFFLLEKYVFYERQ